ncbi:hypothetical protein [Aquimarina rhabdastrellae]
MLKHFIEVTSTFKKERAATNSIEALYDFCYLLENRNRTHEENMMIVDCYSLLKLHDKAFNLFKETLAAKKSLTKKEKQKLKRLEANTRSNDRRYYRDLREAKETKKNAVLTLADFDIIDKQVYFKTDVTDKHIIIFNKKIEKKELTIFYEEHLTNEILTSLISYLNWISRCNDELIKFYNNTEIEYKIDKVSKDWYDGLNVWEINIEIDKQGVIYGRIFVEDYRNHNLGLCVTTKNKTIVTIQYDPIL